jgi:hypothetical protein
VKSRLTLALLGFAACVPSGSAPPYDAGTSAPTAPTFRASLGIMTQPFEDDFDRPDGAEEPAEPGEKGEKPHGDAAALLKAGDAGHHDHDGARGDGIAPPERPGQKEEPAEPEGEGGALPFSADAGSRGPSNLGPNWIPARTHAWRVENGKLCGQGAHNHPVWLNRVLPVNARIEFDAVAYDDAGDLKSEVWGDGHAYAHGTSYTDATSYLTILGGWKNTLHVLARLNEHGEDRKVLPIDKTSDDPRQRPVVKGQVYHFKVERTDGKTIHFFVDGLEYLKWADPNPLVGQGHDHFGFNEWEAKVCFDNVKVTPLP